MENLRNEYVELILKYADEIDVHKGKKPRYPNKFILKMVCEMLIHCTTWRGLGRGQKRKKNFYSAILKRFILWSKHNIFEKAYQEMLKTYVLDEIDKETVLTLYIDATAV